MNACAHTTDTMTAFARRLERLLDEDEILREMLSELYADMRSSGLDETMVKRLVIERRACSACC